jgi:hypothetical protein
MQIHLFPIVRSRHRKPCSILGEGKEEMNETQKCKMVILWRTIEAPF